MLFQKTAETSRTLLESPRVTENESLTHGSVKPCTWQAISWAQVIQICPLVADHPSPFHCYHLVAAGAHLKAESHPDFRENLDGNLS